MKSHNFLPSRSLPTASLALAKEAASRMWSFVLVLASFIVGAALTNVTKWIYVQYDYRYPLFVTATHMVCCWSTGYAVTK